LYSFQFFLEYQVADTCLLVNFIDGLLELIEELLFFPFEVLVLLEAHFVLPLDILEDGVLLHDMVLGLLERAHDRVVLELLLGELLQLLVGLLQGLHYLLVGLLLIHLLLLHRCVLLLRVTQLILQLLDYVQVCVRYFLIVVLDVIVFLLMFGSQVLNSLILFGLDLENKSLPLALHLFSEQEHLVLEFQRDLIRNSLELTAHLSRTFVEIFCQRVKILHVSNFLLLLLDFKCADILFELSLHDTVVVLGILECDLGLLFEFSELVKVLEDQVLDPLLVYFDFDFMLLREILQLPLLVSQLSLLIFQFLLANDPEVVDSLSLILVKTSKVLLLPNFVLEGSALNTE
jgi:hypothetical protein